MKNRNTIDNLRKQTGLKKSDFLRLANISTSTYRRITSNEPVSEEMIYRCLRVLNAQLGTNYRPEDIAPEPEEDK